MTPGTSTLPTHPRASDHVTLGPWNLNPASPTHRPRASNRVAALHRTGLSGLLVGIEGGLTRRQDNSVECFAWVLIKSAETGGAEAGGRGRAGAARRGGRGAPTHC